MGKINYLSICLSKLNGFGKFILFYLVFLTGYYTHVNAQVPTGVTGIWEITVNIEKGEDRGILTLSEVEGRLTGLIDMESSSVPRNLKEISYSDSHLTFQVERLYGGFHAELTISGDRLEGYLIFKDMEAPVEGRRQLENEEVINHAEVIRNWNEQTLARGKQFYDQVCAACHGVDGSSNLPAARSFNIDEFKYGSDPYSIWKTTVEGAGQMGAQRWLTPEDAYAVVQYIREELVKEVNPKAYFTVTEEYLEGLPKPSLSQQDLNIRIRNEALSGSQAFGQFYFSNHLGDYGSALYSSLNDADGADLANAALLINPADSVWMAYNVQRMSTIATWKGNLDLSQTKYQLYRGEGEPTIAGQELPGMDRLHWSYQDRYGQLVNLVSDRTPFTDKWLEYYGHYQHGKNIVLSYSIIGRKILEMPSVQMLDGAPVIQHTMRISAGDSWRKIILGGLGDRDSDTIREGVFSLNNPNAIEGLSEDDWNNPHESLVVTAPGEGISIREFFAAGVQGDTEGMRWVVERGHQLALYFPPSRKAQTIRIHRYSGQGQAQYIAFSSFLLDVQQKAIPDLEIYTEGGERVWNQTVITKGQRNAVRPRYDPIHYGKPDKESPENLVSIPEYYPYTVDQITLPFDNPWGSWIRPSGFDFFPDGRAVVSTYSGDVWLAEGIDEDLEEIRWQRIATGLYDPMGVKVKDNRIYVISRDRIMRLNDLNGDGETDFYESFFADTDVSDVPVQAYNFSLETDSEGNFLYAKAGQYTNNDEPGNLIRVSSDGKTQESVAIGFRAPNGVTVDPQDRIYVSDNQGSWMPANKISMIEEGGFYGYIPSIKSRVTNPGVREYRMRPPLVKFPKDGDILPLSFDKPIIWMPQAFDISPGNGAWTSKEWGPLGDRLIWTSFGKGWAYQVLMHQVDGTFQAAVSALPFQFDSGTQRAAVNPADGQFYVAGISGWDSEKLATKYGSFDRIRHIGGEGFVMDSVKVHSDGIVITFNQELNAEVANRVDNYIVKQWNYRWEERYGSEDWSVKNPEQTGKDDVLVQSVELTDDGKTILIKISDQDLQPVDQMRIQLRLESKDGKKYNDTMYLTIHKVPGREVSQN